MGHCFFNKSVDINRDLSEFLQKEKYSRLVFLVDNNTGHYCLPVFDFSLMSDAVIIAVGTGESNKSLDSAVYVWRELISNNIDKNAILINVGGGAVSDLGGFVASVYKRGIRFINIPTTLMSQIDAAIGGKNGINLDSYKNILGTINLPMEIFVYHNFILTQELREIKSGFAEMIKHALLVGGELWNKTKVIREFDINKVNDLIEDNIKVKCEFVNKDFYDQNLRHALNFGHTIGHAIESMSLGEDWELLHGEAVAIGMIVEAIISKNKGLLSSVVFNEIYDFISLHFSLLPIESDECFWGFLYNDKKNIGKNFRFVLLQDIGDYSIDVLVDRDTIEYAVNEYNSML